MSKVNNSRIQSNLLQQNCFVRDVTRVGGLVTSSSPDTFLSLDEVVTSKGISLVESENPYPITPQYVKSFASSADYRKDPFAAIASSSPRTNLGDISSIQEVSSMDMEQARSLYSQLQSVFLSNPDSKPDSKPDSNSDSRPENNS